MTYQISYGGKAGSPSSSRNAPNEALQFAYALERMGETKIRITDSETQEVYSIGQFERLMQGVKAG